MRGWLLDTNIVSGLRKPRPDAKVRTFFDGQAGTSMFVTEITFAEIRYGIEILDNADHRADLHLWLEHTIRPLFAGRTLAITEDVLVRWISLSMDGRKRGHTFAQPDLFIAAIGALERLIVVSRDVSQFIAAGVPAFDPWESRLHVGGTAVRIEAPVSLDAVTRHIN